MSQKIGEVPFCWHEQVPSALQEVVTRRRHTYVKGAQELEQEGYVPWSQVTMASGRLLRVGDPYVQIMVEGSVKVDEEKHIREDPLLQGKNISIRFASGTVVPLVEPQRITEGRHFRASRRGFTAFVKISEPALLIADRVQEQEPAYATLGSSTVAERRTVVPSVFYSFAQ